MSKINNLLTLLSNAPPGESQMDDSIREDIKKLSILSDDLITKDDVKKIIDDIVYGAKSSDFVLATLEIIMHMIINK